MTQVSGQANTTVKVNLSQPGPTIPQDFIGLSIEVNLVRPMFIGTPGSANEVYFQLLRNLGGSGTFRFGGLSQDRYCWDLSDAPNPAACIGPLTTADLQSFYYASSRTGWPVLLGLNLAQNSGAWASKEIIEGMLPNSTPQQRLGVEIGNEPDGFFEDGLPGNTYIRPSTYELTNYIQEFQSYQNAFSANVPGSTATAGPAFAGRWHQPQLDQFLGAMGKNLSIATMHWYPTVKCRGPVTIANLLDPSILSDYKRVVGGWQTTAANHGFGLQMTETNSTACSGMPGVSDAFASAIWGIDWMLYSATLNLRRINFHNGSVNGQNSYYNVIDSTPSTSGQFSTQAQPLYYAMHLFESAALGNKLYPVTMQTANNITAYATSRCDTCPVHVFVINKDLSASADVTVGFGQPMGPGFEIDLTAPGLDATASTLTYGGQRFDSGSGFLNGALATQSVSSDGGGNYSFHLGNSTAALLTILRSGGALPALTPAGVVSAAANVQTFAPGGLVSIYASNLASTTESAVGPVLPTRLAEVQLTIGGMPVAETYVSPGQINFQIPFNAPPGPANLVYTSGAIVSDAIPVTISQFAPGIFVEPQINATQGAILINGTSSLAAPASSISGARPASRGEYVSIYCTGLGAVQNPPAVGVPAPLNPLSTTTATPSVSIGGVAVQPQFAGLAPNYSGLYQVNVQVPLNVTPGDTVPLTVSIGSVTSNAVTLAVK